MTVGLIASGKSTWAKQFVKDNPNTQRVSRDDIRFMTTDYTYTPENEKIVDILYRNLIKSLLQNTDKDIILDEQNLNVERREAFKEWILSFGKDIEFIEKEFPITLYEAIERDKKRSFPIGEGVIKKTWHNNEIYLKQMIERYKPKYESNPELPSCIIIDIDGTLSNSVDRRIFDFKACINDKVIEPVKAIVSTYRYNPNVTIILLSGRDSICRVETIEWLTKNIIPYDFLYMRKEKDNRSDVVVKGELFNAYIKDKYNPLFVIDDRKCMVEMWVNMGLFCFDVSQDPYGKNNF
jgi:predicted kinase